MIKIELIDENGDLARNVWVFHVETSFRQNVEIELNKWCLEERQSKKHGWKKGGEGYKERHQNSAVHHGGWRKPAAEVPMPKNLAQRLIAELVSRVVFFGAKDPPKDLK